MQAKEYVLDTRGRNQPMVLGPKAREAPEDERLRPGAYVVLKRRQFTMDVEVLDEEEPGTFVGHIRGWEGHAGRGHKGLVVGDVLRFRPEHVFEVRHDLNARPTIGAPTREVNA